MTIHNRARKSTGSAPAPSVDAEKLQKKLSTYWGFNQHNATNLVNTTPRRKALTHANNSWTSLPPSLAKLGNELLKYSESDMWLLLEPYRKILLRCLRMERSLCLQIYRGGKHYG